VKQARLSISLGAGYDAYMKKDGNKQSHDLFIYSNSRPTGPLCGALEFSRSWIPPEGALETLVGRPCSSNNR
jgi:hypothetical protein